MSVFVRMRYIDFLKLFTSILKGEVKENHR